MTRQKNLLESLHVAGKHGPSRMIPRGIKIGKLKCLYFRMSETLIQFYSGQIFVANVLKLLGFKRVRLLILKHCKGTIALQKLYL